MDYTDLPARAQAEHDFNRARNQAFWSRIWARLSGQSTELLSFEDVKHSLRLSDGRNLGLQDIPLDHIVGSVGRYKDFDRKFLPKKSVNSERWKKIDMLTLAAEGFPPIEVYKVGEAYFVLDGNHRVSVARANGATVIEAFVTEFKTDVPFNKDIRPEHLSVMEGYAYFLRETDLKALRPQSEVTLTEPSRYPEILEHIQVHHYFIGLDCECPINWHGAVASWYDHVYFPMVESIREHNMLEDFPDRTEADLYVWLIRHQAEMQEYYSGEPLSPQETIGDFLEKIHP